MAGTVKKMNSQIFGRTVFLVSGTINIEEAYMLSEKHPELDGGSSNIKNIGWSLGNACPYKCKQCYSLPVRKSNMDLSMEMIDMIIEKINTLKVDTVNIGGNEPWLTNGLHGESLLPYVLHKLKSIGVSIGITSSGITIIKIFEKSPELFSIINDIDISLDSPIEEEHNENRGADIFKHAIKGLELCQKFKIPRSIIVCVMDWNFTRDRIEKLLDLSRKYDANIRFNTLKPLVKSHMGRMPTVSQFFDNFRYLLSECETLDITEPRLSGFVGKSTKGCPCGRTSLRIHSITEDGKIPLSPCVYLHDYKVGDLLKDNINDIINSPPFNEFRRRSYNPESIKGCTSCDYINECKGGCATRAYLHNYWTTGKRSLYVRESGCLKDYIGNRRTEYSEKSGQLLVHMDYLCTWIGKPKKNGGLVYGG